MDKHAYNYGMKFNSDSATNFFCSQCGGNMKNEYRYCPSCGMRSEQFLPMGTILNNTFIRLETVSQEMTSLRIAKMDAKLERLERELDAIAQFQAKRSSRKE
jgi:hypothetical protein